MDKVVGAIVTVVVIAGIFLLMYRGWRGKQRRDAEIVMPQVEMSQAQASIEVFYVATTLAENNLERVALAAFAYRGYGVLDIAVDGLCLTMSTGEHLALSRDLVSGLAVTTSVIDKVVEKDGLVSILWTGEYRDGRAVELATHIRIPRSSDRDLLFDLFDNSTQKTK